VEFLLVLLVLAVVVAVIAAPLRGRAGTDAAQEAAESGEREVLEAAKEAKYREIRDAELDYRTGKLSEGDWRVLDRSLRAEAVELLKRLDAVQERERPLT
jgi:flagellar biosynthesis/type III secretory pathway M-ring protein FliF/YscJ